MRTKAEELLYILMWTCDMLWRPTFRNLTDSFESWAYRNGLLRELERLEQQRFLECQRTSRFQRVYRLSDAGRVHLVGDRDPVAHWSRPWDGQWRMVLFDVPEARHAARDRLRRYLQERGFGYLQKSAWITPDPIDKERSMLADGPVDVHSLILLEARPSANETDQDIVTAAWDFENINEGYAKYLKILAQRPQGSLQMHSVTVQFQRWLQEERRGWLNIIQTDPLLPQVLLPDGYLGQKAWDRRLEAMKEAGEQMRNFRP